MSEIIFVMPASHKDRVDAVCFDCGKIIIECIVVDMFVHKGCFYKIPCFPCKEETCPHEIKREDLGQGTIANEEKHLFFRCLKALKEKDNE